MFNEFMMKNEQPFMESDDSIFKKTTMKIKWKRKKFLKLTLKLNNKMEKDEWLRIENEFRNKRKWKR